MRRLLVALLVLVGLAVAGDFGFRLWAESTLEARIDESLGLPERPDVDIHGFPFTLQVVRSRFQRVDLELESLQAGGLTMRRVSLELHRVRYPRDRLFTKGDAMIRAASGVAVVEVTDDAVSAYLEARGVPLKVGFAGPEVRATGTISLAGLQVEVSATAELGLEDGNLVFRPQEVEVADGLTVPATAVAFEVPLPQPVPGVHLERIAVRDGVARVEGDLRDLTFRVEG